MPTFFRVSTSLMWSSIRAADKASRKAEAQAKYEAARSEQLQKMAIAKAEAQRQAETAAKASTVVKPAPKSMLGRFGARLTEAVLFPSGGEKSTMF